MTEETQQESVESLGEYLQRKRKEKNYTRDDILNETKIPPKSLKAMEENDYASLPADAFARGFYTLYAKCLDLDIDPILQRYYRERKQLPPREHLTPPSQQHKAIDTMASPSPSPTSSIAFALVIIIAITAFFSYYFSFNPATYISDKLRSFQEPVPAEEPLEPLNSEAGTNTAIVPEAEEARYFLTIAFKEDTEITITIDDGLPQNEFYSAGSTQSWQADSSFMVLLPGTTEAELLLNGSQIPLPAAENGVISLNLP